MALLSGVTAHVVVIRPSRFLLLEFSFCAMMIYQKTNYDSFTDPPYFIACV